MLDQSGTVRPRAPEPIIRRLRARARSESSETDEREPRAGVDVVNDQYLPSRAPNTRPSEARSFRLATAQAVDPTPGHVPSKVVAGATGRRLLGVRFGEPGVHTIRLVYRSPYTTREPIERYSLHTIVETRRRGISVAQLASHDDDEAWVRDVARRQLSEPPPALDQTTRPWPTSGRHVARDEDGSESRSSGSRSSVATT